MPISLPNAKAFQQFLLKKYDENHSKKVQEHKDNFGWLGSKFVPMDSRYDVRFTFQSFKQNWIEFNKGQQGVNDQDLKTAFEQIDSPDDKDNTHRPDGHHNDGFLSLV